MLIDAQVFNELDFRRFKAKAKDIEVRAHVVDAGRPRQRGHPDVDRKSKYNLAGAAIIAPSNVL
jgi:hypothetical protein